MQSTCVQWNDQHFIAFPNETVSVAVDDHSKFIHEITSNDHVCVADFGSSVESTWTLHAPLRTQKSDNLLLAVSVRHVWTQLHTWRHLTLQTPQEPGACHRPFWVRSPAVQCRQASHRSSDLADLSPTSPWFCACCALFSEPGSAGSQVLPLCTLT
jgi:hypothetical protein